MTRKFEQSYRASTNTQILTSENSFRKDVDLRLDTLENQGDVIVASTQELKARALRFLEQEIAPKAQEIEEKLVEYRKGVSADFVIENASKTFLTPERQDVLISQALGTIRDHVEERGNTLFKLLALIDALPQLLGGNVEARGNTLAKLLALIDALKGNVAARGDSLSKLLSLIDTKADTTTLAGYVSQTGVNGAAMLPGGADTQRPTSPVRGAVRYSLNSSRLEWYNGSSWQKLPNQSDVDTKADLASPNFSGTPTIGGYSIAQVSTSTLDQETSFPVGTTILVQSSTAVDRNSAIVPRIFIAGKGQYANGGSGASLSGTWGASGALGTTLPTFVLCRRIA